MKIKDNKLLGITLLYILLVIPGIAYLYYANKIHWYISLLIAIFLFCMYFVLVVGGWINYIKFRRLMKDV